MIAHHSVVGLRLAFMREKRTVYFIAGVKTNGVSRHIIVVTHCSSGWKTWTLMAFGPILENVTTRSFKTIVSLFFGNADQMHSDQCSRIAIAACNQAWCYIHPHRYSDKLDFPTNLTHLCDHLLTAREQNQRKNVYELRPLAWCEGKLTLQNGDAYFLFCE